MSAKGGTAHSGWSAPCQCSSEDLLGWKFHSLTGRLQCWTGDFSLQASAQKVFYHSSCPLPLILSPLHMQEFSALCQAAAELQSDSPPSLFSFLSLSSCTAYPSLKMLLCLSKMCVPSSDMFQAPRFRAETDGSTGSSAWKRKQGLVQLLIEKLTFAPACCQSQRPPASGGRELVSAMLEGLWQVLNPSKESSHRFGR